MKKISKKVEMKTVAVRVDSKKWEQLKKFSKKHKAPIYLLLNTILADGIKSLK